MSERALRPSPTLTQVYLYRQAVDFRYGYRRLAAIVEQELGHNPFSGALYVFVNRQRTKLKILLWEDNGFVLYYKALAEERFCWPRHDQTLLTITGQQLNWLLDGAPQAHRRQVYGNQFVMCKAIGKMTVGPSESAIRSRLQTTPSGCY